MEMIRAQNGVAQVANLSANNLLQKFIITSSNHFRHRESEYGENQEEEEEENKDIELTLGLSLNGQFGTDPRSRKRKNFELGRSSSIPEGYVDDNKTSAAGGGTGVIRRTVVESGSSDMFQLDRARSLPVKTDTEMKRKRSEKTESFLNFQVPSPTNVTNQTNSSQSRAFLEFKVPPPTKRKEENVDKKKKNVEVTGVEQARNILEDMPCVSTRNVGANGKRIQGFLYWYGGNKEDVKIVCVCHGSFLSPAEFVKHGGVTDDHDDGGDVTVNPLRHIVVKLPSSSL